MSHICIARKKTDKFKRCTRNIYKDCYCKVHYKCKDILNYNIPLYTDEEVLNAIKNFNNNNYDIELIKYCLFIYNKNYKVSKKILLNNFYNLQKELYNYIININKIIKIQSFIRKYNVLKINKIKGINYYIYNNKNIVNETDFYTCDNIKNIKYDYIFLYKDIDNYIYAFDIRSVHLLIKNNNKNPYNRNEIPLYVINNINILNNYLYKNNLIENFEVINLNSEQLLRQKCLEIFQKIDKYYYTNINWFLNLNIINLKIFYNTLEDIWNWRAQLSNQTKFNIIQNNIIFRYINYINNITNINIKKIQQIILDDINILVSNGVSNEDKSLGALYVLVALSSVSNECSTSMPWLLQALY